MPLRTAVRVFNGILPGPQRWSKADPIAPWTIGATRKVCAVCQSAPGPIRPSRGGRTRASVFTTRRHETPQGAGSARRRSTAGGCSRNKDGSRVRLVSGMGIEHAKRCLDVVAAVAALPVPTLVLDTEVAVFDDQPRSRLDLLATGMPALWPRRRSWSPSACSIEPARSSPAGRRTNGAPSSGTPSPAARPHRPSADRGRPGGLAARGGGHRDEQVAARETDEIPSRESDRGTPMHLTEVARNAARSEYRVSHSKRHGWRRP
jgi:hypothetical protein